MLDTHAPRVEWSPNSPTNSRSCHRDRCITPRMGGGIRSKEHWWPLVRSRERGTHQCPGASWGGSCNEDVHEGQGEHPCPPQNGQQDSDCLHQSHGGYKVSYPLAGGLRPMALVSATGNHTISRTYTRGREHDSRHGVQDTAVISRMEAGR